MISFLVMPFINPTSFPAARISDPATILSIFWPLLYIGGGLLVLIMLGRGAFLILTGGSNKEQITKGKNTFSFTILGIFIIISAYLIVKLIGYITGVTIPI